MNDETAEENADLGAVHNFRICSRLCHLLFHKSVQSGVGTAEGRRELPVPQPAGD